MSRPIADDLQVYRVFDFSGGLDLQTTPAKLALLPSQNRLTVATHVVYNTDGAVTKRLDEVVYNSVDNLGADVAITGGIQYRRSDGTLQIVVGTNDGRLVRLDADGTATTLASGLASLRRWSFAIFNDDLICCNGADPPRKYNGSTVSVLGGSPPSRGSVVVAHRNRVWMLDDGNSHRLSFCALNNHEDWTTPSNAGFIFVNPGDGQPLRGMLSLLQGELILTKPNALYRVQGATYDEISVVPISAGSSVGGVSHQGIVMAANDGWFVAQDGVHVLSAVREFGDLREATVSDRVRPYFRPGTPVTVGLALLSRSKALFDRANNRLMFALPLHE